MSKCPYCNNEIKTLTCEVKYTETGIVKYEFNPNKEDKYDEIERDTKDVITDADSHTFVCPFCREEITDNETDAEEFLKVRKDDEKVNTQ